MSVNTHVAQMLRTLADLLDAEDAPGTLDLSGLLGNLAGAKLPGFPPGMVAPGFPPGAAPEVGSLYPGEDHLGDGIDGGPAADHFDTDGTDGPTVHSFDPHDLPLERYEDCEEKQKQIDDPDRRAELHGDPLKWMTVAAYYANKLTIPEFNAEDAALSIIMLPGAAHIRVAEVQQRLDGGVFYDANPDSPKTKHAREYDALWAECYIQLHTAHFGDPQRLDSVDHQSLLVAFGEPCQGSAWRGVNATLQAAGRINQHHQPLATVDE